MTLDDFSVTEAEGKYHSSTMGKQDSQDLIHSQHAKTLQYFQMGYFLIHKYNAHMFVRYNRNYEHSSYTDSAVIIFIPDKYEALVKNQTRKPYFKY